MSGERAVGQALHLRAGKHRRIVAIAGISDQFQRFTVHMKAGSAKAFHIHRQCVADLPPAIDDLAALFGGRERGKRAVGNCMGGDLVPATDGFL